MNTDILKQLFIELFEVNHIMLDLINKFENTDYGDEILVGFYMENITEEFNKEDLLKHREETSYSCLGSLNNEDLEEFLDDLFR